MNEQKLIEAAKAFLARVDELGKHLAEQQVFLDAHGIQWIHGDWCIERDALIAALKDNGVDYQ